MATNRREFIGGVAALTAGLLAPGCRMLGDGRGGAYWRVRDEALDQIAAGVLLGAAVGRNGGPFVYAGRQGPQPDAAPVDDETLFDMASVTKTVVASVCASLAAEGRLDPDAPFTRYFPEHVLGDACDITVRDLATHASGFGNFSGRRYAEDYARHGGAAGFETELRTKCPERPRGTYCYSCYNYALLGTVAERAGGQPLDVLAAERVFRPLGMTRTRWWPVVGSPHAITVPLRMHDGLLRRPGEVHDEVARYAGRPIGNAGVFSTLPDMMRFTEDLLTRRCFPKAHYDLLFTCTFERDGARRSFGFDLSAEGRIAGISPRSIRHTGFTGQLICVDPETGFAGVALTVRTDRKPRPGHGRSQLLALTLT